MSIDLHYVYHPVGAKWGVGTTNPTQAQLATIGNWTKVYENKNLGIVSAPPLLPTSEVTNHGFSF
jgi:hypothetical protein